MDNFQIIDLIAVFVFGLSGALVASRAQLDIVGFIFFACLTGVGGGTFRDLVLGLSPVFWIKEPNYLFVATAAALIVFFVAPMLESRYRWLVWIDAAAVSVAVPSGVVIALDVTSSWPIALLMGAATGTFGGLLRDVIANEVPLLLTKGEMHASAAFAGALMFPLAAIMDLPASWDVGLAAAVTFLLRGGSIIFGWRLPAYKSRPPTDGAPQN